MHQWSAYTCICHRFLHRIDSSYKSKLDHHTSQRRRRVLQQRQRLFLLLLHHRRSRAPPSYDHVDHGPHPEQLHRASTTKPRRNNDRRKERRYDNRDHSHDDRSKSSRTGRKDACMYYDKIQHCADVWGGVQIRSGNNSRRSRPQCHHGSDIGVSSSSYNTPQERESTPIRRAWLWVYIAATATVSGSIKDATRLNRLAWSPTRCLHVLKTRKESKFANDATMTTLAPCVGREPRLVRMPKWICWLLEVFSNQQQANHESRSSTCGCHTNQIEVTKIRSLHALYGSACMQIGKHRSTRAHACARVYIYVRVHHVAATKSSTVNSLHLVTSSPAPT